MPIAILIMAMAAGGQSVHGAANGFCQQEQRCNLATTDMRREIEDAGTGSRWFLFRDASHLAGPGRLVLDGTRQATHYREGCETASRQQFPAQFHSDSQKLIIRAGDRLVVREHSDRVDVQVEGVALTPGSAGSVLKARLNVGGGIVRAVAVQPGQVTLLPQREPQP